VTEQLDLFLQSPARNQWLLSPTIDVYVRKGVARDTVVGKVEPLELANINVRPKLQNTGVFTKVLCHVERLGYPVLIENILSKRFREFFIKRGYQPITKQNYGTVIKNFIG
jgi:N-acetylglutamate synthase-like GNAT family acetyltransferase